MKRHNVSEVLPELLSELVFIALLVVGVSLFFLWTRSRPRRVTAPERVPAVSAAERTAGEPETGTELEPFEEPSLSA